MHLFFQHPLTSYPSVPLISSFFFHLNYVLRKTFVVIFSYLLSPSFMSLKRLPISLLIHIFVFFFMVPLFQSHFPSFLFLFFFYSFHFRISQFFPNFSFTYQYVCFQENKFSLSLFFPPIPFIPSFIPLPLIKKLQLLDHLFSFHSLPHPFFPAPSRLTLLLLFHKLFPPYTSLPFHGR